jgi:hypothetical protein
MCSIKCKYEGNIEGRRSGDSELEMRRFSIEGGLGLEEGRARGGGSLGKCRGC